VSSIGAAEGLAINAPSALEAVEIGGRSFLLAAATGSSSISVFEIGPGGALIATDHVVDDRTSRFQNLTALETVTVDGRAYVIAGGADDGLSLFTLLPDGRLLHLDTIEDRAGLSLQNVSAVSAAVAHGRVQVFAGSGSEAGLTQLDIALGSAGQIVAAGGPGRMDATVGDDILQDSPGDDDLRGLAGDDILIGGRGADRLYGGTGRDIFVLAADGTGDQIRDFERGLDSIDL
ncbi:MAG: calcium-binding protein, partial [Sedimentitalea sp.]|nr:calcium-binding protein [Sedimentitalea sp.]